MEDWKKETDHAHHRIDSVIKEMHDGFTGLRREMSRDKADIMNAIDKRPVQNNAAILALFATVVISLGSILAFLIRSVDSSSKERHGASKEILGSRIASLQKVEKQNYELIIHHQKKVIEINARQDENLRWLEKMQDRKISQSIKMEQRHNE
jgi:hypothetical protein